MSAPENSKPSLRIPPWLRVKLPCNHTFSDTRALVEGLDLHTVCHSAKCPNMFECFSRKTATFLILGNTCTRNCAFCNIGGGIIQSQTVRKHHSNREHLTKRVRDVFARDIGSRPMAGLEQRALITKRRAREQAE